jgi:LemA protein
MEPGAAGIVAVVLAVVTWAVDRRRRRYVDLPTTPAAAVFAGRNEVKGRAWTSTPLLSHRTQTPSVWWDFCEEEERVHTRTVTQSDGRGGTTTRTETTTEWHEIDRRSGSVPTVDVVDDTGSVPVRLERANVVPRQVLREVTRRTAEGGLLKRMLTQGNRTGRYRETERVVAVGDALYVVGDAELDEATCVPVIGGRALLSTRSEQSHTGWLAVAVVALLVLTVAAVTAAVALLVEPDDPGRPVAWGLGLGASALVLLVAWGIVLHNRLRSLAQGIDRAWSLTDVQLQRRHDLVPALARVVAAHATHERDVTTSVVEGRWQAGRAHTGEQLSAEAAEQTGALRQLLAVAEAYPALTADQSFERLQAELADTETRIAASRTFYNDSVTLLRDRAHSFPGVLVAALVKPEHRDLIPAAGFERTVPQVEVAFS